MKNFRLLKFDKFVGAYLISIWLFSCNGHGEMMRNNIAVSEELALRSSVVVRARILEPGEGSKYRWAKIKVIEVIKNTTGNPIGTTLDVAYISSEDPAFLAGDFVAYLEPYNVVKNDGVLKFLDGSLHGGTTR